MEPLTPDHVQSTLDHFNLGLRIRFFENSTATSQLAADNIGCELGQIAKSICFIIQEQPVLVIASGDQRVDDRKLAALYNLSRKQIKLATAEQCIDLFGYAPGGVPPIGHRQPPSAIYLDDMLKRYDTVYPAGGSSNAIFGLPLAQLEQITGGRFADLRKES